MVDVVLLVRDLIGQIAPPGAQWGVFSGGGAVITADTVTSLDYKQEWAISDFPVEEGAFESYDKVALPYDARVRFAAGGSDANRAALLGSIAAVAGTTQVFDVVTPEAVYVSATISHYSYTRTANRGLGLIQVDVWLLQIVESIGAGQNTAQPDGAGRTILGSVQALEASAQQAAQAELATTGKLQ